MQFLIYSTLVLVAIQHSSKTTYHSKYTKYRGDQSGGSTMMATQWTMMATNYDNDGHNNGQ